MLQFYTNFWWWNITSIVRPRSSIIIVPLKCLEILIINELNPKKIGHVFSLTESKVWCSCSRCQHSRRRSWVTTRWARSRRWESFFPYSTASSNEKLLVSVLFYISVFIFQFNSKIKQLIFKNQHFYVLNFE